jgi:hypothetical protein
MGSLGEFDTNTLNIWGDVGVSLDLMYIYFGSYTHRYFEMEQ